MKYALKANDGSVYITTIIGDETIEGVLEKFHPDRRAKIVSWREITDEKIPPDRSFRDAWTDDLPTETIDIHMGRAREIHMNRIRKARDDHLSSLDLETFRGNDVQDKKQILRDIPQKFDLSKAQTPDELKLLWPVELLNSKET